MKKNYSYIKIKSKGQCDCFVFYPKDNEIGLKKKLKDLKKNILPGSQDGQILAYLARRLPLHYSVILMDDDDASDDFDLYCYPDLEDEIHVENLQALTGICWSDLDISSDIAHSFIVITDMSDYIVADQLALLREED